MCVTSLLDISDKASEFRVEGNEVKLPLVGLCEALIVVSEHSLAETPILDLDGLVGQDYKVYKCQRAIWSLTLN